MSEEQSTLIGQAPIIVGQPPPPRRNDLDQPGDPLLGQVAPVIAEVAAAVTQPAEGSKCWYCAFLTGRFREKGPLHVTLETENFFYEIRERGSCLTSPALAEILFSEWMAKIYIPLIAAGITQINEYKMTAVKFEHCIQRETFAFHARTRLVDRQLEIDALADHLFRNTTTTNEANETQLNYSAIGAYIKLVTAQVRPSYAESSGEGWQPIKPGKRKRGF